MEIIGFHSSLLGTRSGSAVRRTLPLVRVLCLCLNLWAFCGAKHKRVRARGFNENWVTFGPPGA